MKDKVVVITGGSRGFGRALAEVFIARGAKVIISSRDKKELEETADEIKATSVVADVTKEKEILNLRDEAVKRFGKIDYWINNAGIWFCFSTIEELDIPKVHDLMEVNLFGTMYGSRAALIQMKDQGFGTIVNIISVSGLRGRAKSSGYAATKYAVRGFTESLREACKETPIKVIAVYPGGMKTEIFHDKKPSDYDKFMDVESVAERTVMNLEAENPKEDLIIEDYVLI
ncbi:MAG: SDR family NAD(P)-dependent oxidoreductase [Candidatus Pacebacteria bacterium]|nr:SDR family NAD(P)-dependent oxidoreductase [Candidatus Paceibacterota bacterium]MDD5357245.1 SDR family NAD(P)-dependent oxidoreductase [Candidatus Paceibacterota bacterium]